MEKLELEKFQKKFEKDEQEKRVAEEKRKKREEKMRKAEMKEQKQMDALKLKMEMMQLKVKLKEGKDSAAEKELNKLKEEIEVMKNQMEIDRRERDRLLKQKAIHDIEKEAENLFLETELSLATDEIQSLKKQLLNEQNEKEVFLEKMNGEKEQLVQKLKVTKKLLDKASEVEKLELEKQLEQLKKDQENLVQGIEKEHRQREMGLKILRNELENAKLRGKEKEKDAKMRKEKEKQKQLEKTNKKLKLQEEKESRKKDKEKKQQALKTEMDQLTKDIESKQQDKSVDPKHPEEMDKLREELEKMKLQLLQRERDIEMKNETLKNKDIALKETEESKKELQILLEKNTSFREKSPKSPKKSTKSPEKRTPKSPEEKSPKSPEKIIETDETTSLFSPPPPSYIAPPPSPFGTCYTLPTSAKSDEDEEDIMEDSKYKEELSKGRLLRKQRESEFKAMTDELEKTQKDTDDEKARINMELTKIKNKIKSAEEGQEKDLAYLQEKKEKKDKQERKAVKQRIKERTAHFVTISEEQDNLEYALKKFEKESEKQIEKLQYDVDKYKKQMDKEQEWYDKMVEKERKRREKQEEKRLKRVQKIANKIGPKKKKEEREALNSSSPNNSPATVSLSNSTAIVSPSISTSTGGLGDLGGLVAVSGSVSSLLLAGAVADTSVAVKVRREVQKQEKENEKEMKKKEIDTQRYEAKASKQIDKLIVKQSRVSLNLGKWKLDESDGPKTTNRIVSTSFKEDSLIKEMKKEDSPKTKKEDSPKTEKEEKKEDSPKTKKEDSTKIKKEEKMDSPKIKKEDSSKTKKEEKMDSTKTKKEEKKEDSTKTKKEEKKEDSTKTKKEEKKEEKMDSPNQSLTPSGKNKKKLLLFVVHEEGNVKMEVTVNSLEDLKSKIASKLKLKMDFRLEYFDSEFSEYASLSNFGSLEFRMKLRVNTIQIQKWQFGGGFQNHPNWETKGTSNISYRSLVLMDERGVVEEKEYERVLDILKKSGADSSLIGKIRQVSAFQNDSLEQGFMFYSYSLMEKFKSAPQLFKKQHWLQRPDVEQRTWVHSRFQKYSKKFKSFNFDVDVPIVPFFQGTAKSTATKIAQTGFTTVATLDDGWYARGIYFTSSIKYASYYSKLAMQGTDPYSYIIIAFTSPGNVYPVIEGPVDKGTLKGRPGVISPGYQSHYVCVCGPKSTKPGWPCVKGEKQFVDEMVLFQDAQAVPKYLLVIEREPDQQIDG